MKPIKLSKSERALLVTQAKSRAGGADAARRARLILLLESGRTNEQIRRQLDCSDAFIYRWIRRFQTQGLAGLFGRRHSAPKSRKSRHSAADDVPNGVKRAADIVGLYLHPTLHAAVFCIGESIQNHPILNRIGSASMPTLTAQHVLQSSRPGVRALYATLNALTTEALGSPVARSTSADFSAFLNHLIAQQPRGKELHVLLADDLSAQKNLQIKDLPAAPCNVHLHFTGTYRFWLRRVAMWLAAIERAANVGHTFLPPPNLTRTLMAHIRRYHREGAAMAWKYFDPHRAKSSATLH